MYFITVYAEQYSVVHYFIVILYNTRGCPFLLLCPSQILHPTFSAYISWNNRRVLMFQVSKQRIEVSDMIRLFAGGARAPLVVKILIKQPWVKIKNLRKI